MRSLALASALALASCSDRQPEIDVRSWTTAAAPVLIDGAARPYNCVNRSTVPVFVGETTVTTTDQWMRFCRGCVLGSEFGGDGVRTFMVWGGTLDNCGHNSDEPCVTCAVLPRGGEVSRRKSRSTSERVIVIGDVHGCLDELRDLPALLDVDPRLDAVTEAKP